MGHSLLRRRLGQLRFWGTHLVAIVGTFWVGVTREAFVCAVVLYLVRMFGVTAGYHRYFSHRAFKTSRVGQFLLALLAESSSQMGVLWWAAHHRRHHLFSDTPKDVHSPKQHGFWYAHVSWIWNGCNTVTNMGLVRDFARYPELCWLNRHWILPPLGLAILCWWTLGLSGLFVGFGLSTLAVWHATFAINSLMHLFGTQRYNTDDDSRNSLWLALLTMGEGWHNNHHHYKNSARQGFYWWEIDVTYWVLRTLQMCGLVWGIREPPERVYRADLLPAAQKDAVVKKRISSQ